MVFEPPPDAPTTIKYFHQDDLNTHKVPRGHYSVGPDGEVWIRCPLCAIVAPCGHHSKGNVGTDRLSLSPSLKCAAANHSTNPCGAHYYVVEGEICKWQDDTVMPPNGFESNHEFGWPEGEKEGGSS